MFAVDARPRFVRSRQTRSRSRSRAAGPARRLHHAARASTLARRCAVSNAHRARERFKSRCWPARCSARRQSEKQLRASLAAKDARNINQPCNRLARPRLAATRQDSPSPACLAKSRRAQPSVVVPSHAPPRLSRLALRRYACQATPHLVKPCEAPPSHACRERLAQPSPACPCRARTRHASPALRCQAMPFRDVPGHATPRSINSTLPVLR